MSEKEATEEEITEALNKIINCPGYFENPHDVLKMLAKLIWNLRFDLQELKTELINHFKNMDLEDLEEEYVPESEDDLKKLDASPERFFNDFYA